MSLQETFVDATFIERAMEIAMESIPEEERDPEKMAANTEVIANFLKGAITQDDAAAQFMQMMGTDEPIKRLDAFMKTMNPQPPLQSLKVGPGYRKTPKRWTKEEDSKLIAAVQNYGTENWPAVAQYVGGGRTRSQCSQRWNRGLDPRISKCNWSQEEETKLLEKVKLFGSKAWTRIAQEMGNRSDVQCRFRYKFLQKKAKEAGTEIQPISAPMALTHALHGPPTEVPCILEHDQTIEVLKGDSEQAALTLPQPKE